MNFSTLQGFFVQRGTTDTGYRVKKVVIFKMRDMVCLLAHKNNPIEKENVGEVWNGIWYTRTGTLLR